MYEVHQTNFHEGLSAFGRRGDEIADLARFTAKDNPHFALNYLCYTGGTVYASDGRRMVAVPVRGDVWR